jgi:hypothetical protein
MNKQRRNIIICVVTVAFTIQFSQIHASNGLPINPYTPGWHTGISSLNMIAKQGEAVAGAQAGNLGFWYNKGRAINLDGVVNMDAYKFRQNGSMDEYLRNERVSYLADEQPWVYEISKQWIKSPQAQTQYMANLELIWSKPGIGFTIYKLNKVKYSKIALPKVVDPNWAQVDQPFSLTGNSLFASEVGQNLTFRVGNCTKLSFIAHPWSGEIIIFNNGQLFSRVDLYRPTTDWNYLVDLKLLGNRNDVEIRIVGKNEKSYASQVWLNGYMSSNCL